MKINKRILWITLLILVGQILLAQSQESKTGIKLDSIHENSDSVEYEILIIDIGFDTWLITNAKPKEFYSQTYYENWNRRYVVEWNSQYYRSMNSNLFESYIDYNPTIDYGLELNYQLYNYFLFFEQKNSIRLINRGRY